MKKDIKFSRDIPSLSNHGAVPSFSLGKLFVYFVLLAFVDLSSTSALAHSLAGKALAEKISMVPGTGVAIKDFSLIDTQDAKVVYPKLASGQWSIVYFGFTNCKSACPMTASYLRAELSDWPAEARPKVVFVSVDPATDKPDVMKKWLSHFDSAWVGLTGTKQEIALAAKPFGVSHSMDDGQLSATSADPKSPVNVPGKAGGRVSGNGNKKTSEGGLSASKRAAPQTPEEVMHSSYLYVVDPSGQWRAYLPAPAKKGVLKEGLISLGVPQTARKSGGI